MALKTDAPLDDHGAHGDDVAQALFNRQLALYRKVTRENLMYHREVYGLLREVVDAEAPKPFSFLDVACGDASASAAMLRDTAIAHYHGIDMSVLSLDLAKENLASLPCKVELHCQDFADVLQSWTSPVDIVWIGMSLHHLQSPEKQNVMRCVRSALKGSGSFLIWEPTLFKDEDRFGWLARYSACRPQWTALDDDEFEEMVNHSRVADFPETPDVWMSMGHQAGFSQAAELYTMPNRLGRVFKFWN
jgi:SAM-dependent methyltransferase